MVNDHPYFHAREVWVYLNRNGLTSTRAVTARTPATHYIHNDVSGH